MKYNLRKIMTLAWKLYRKGGLSFAEALHRAWLSAKAEPINAARIEEAKAAFEAKDYEKVASFLPTENREMILMALKSNLMKVELGNILSKEKREQDVLIVCEAKIGDDSGTYDVPKKKVNDAWTISIGGIKKHGDSTPQ